MAAPRPPARLATWPPARILLPLFAVQFLSWAAMFCLWIYAVPVIAGHIFHDAGDAARTGTALAVIGGCYALYAILGASLAFVLPVVLARLGVRLTYALGLGFAAAGIASLGVIVVKAWLIPAFAAIGVGWSVMANIPYAVLSAAAPAGRGAHMLRVFGFSTVAPQVVMTLLLAFVGPHLTAGQTQDVMLLGGVLMAGAALLVLVAGGGFAISEEVW